MPVLVLDVGGAVAGDSEYDFVKLKSILRGQKQMGLSAFNLGGPESQFSADQLRSLAKDLEIPFVSANLRDAQGQPIAPAMKVFDSGKQKNSCRWCD